jgi:transposase
MRDDRPWGGTDPPAVAYVYAPDRKGSQPIAHLSGFKGVLQVDGYAGYRALADKGDVSLAFCWAHLRRRFYERPVAEASPIANETLQRIAALYRMETDIRGRGPDQRRAVRQERSRPLLAELEPWLREKLALVSRKSKLAQAIRYALSHWDGLTRFLDDGRIEIDSGAAAHRRALSDGDRHSWPRAGQATRRPPGTIASASRRTRTVAARKAHSL